jgi:hypothetical protein
MPDLRPSTRLSNPATSAHFKTSRMVVKFDSYETAFALSNRPRVTRFELRGKNESMRLHANARELLVAYFPELDLDEIRVREGIPWYVPMKVAAYTNRNHIYFARGQYRPESLSGLALIAHELAHCAQYKRHGTWRFRMMYAWAWAVGMLRHSSFVEAYWRNRFEVAARAREDMVYDDLSNQLS